MSSDGNGVPRTLADDLRQRSDAALEALFEARPDLLSPVPTDMTDLVARAATRLSVNRALDRLDRFTLQVLDALAHLPDPTDVDAMARLVPVDRPALSNAVSALRDLALAWGPDDSLRLVRAVREAVGPGPGRTGPPLATAAAGYPAARLQQLLVDLGLPTTVDPPSALNRLLDVLGNPDRLAALLADAPPAAIELLAKVDAGGSGRVERADRAVRPADAATPLEWLLARGLLIAVDADTVVLPAEVAVARRGGALHPNPALHPPAAAPIRVGVNEADRIGAGQALTTVRLVEDLLAAWATDPPSVLRSGGGLGVRDTRRAETVLGLPAEHAALIVELTYVSGLVAADGEDPESWVPTPAYDRWLALDTAPRWALLAEAWLATSRVSSFIGSKPDYGTNRDRPLSPLSADLDRAWAPTLRAGVITELAALPNGTATHLTDLWARLAWRAPRRTGASQELFVRATLAEAALLGLTGQGALTSYARRLAGEGSDAASDKLEKLLPTPLDHVLIQADLTAVAPGPLRRDLALELALAARVESTGAATVYRFSEASIRHALDVGRNAADLHELFARASRTPVPQPLTYLIDDVARRHGHLRVGAAGGYIRCDDEALIAELVADRRAAPLKLRRLAPTVLVAGVGPEAVLTKLRELGYAPTAESAAGTVVLT
ncbi:MAG TPA: helicase-associated domain-containing protein, partial [Sporichthyaceae bacterium]|nr:helicase-associated domain-containing protein [Sporichthyaceae bacterium]